MNTPLALSPRDDMVNDFRRWLQEKYGTPAALSTSWRRPVASFAEAEAPESGGSGQMEDLVAQLDWLEFSDGRTVSAGRGGVAEYLSLGGPLEEDWNGLRSAYDRIRLVCRERLSGRTPFTVSEVLGAGVSETDPTSAAFAVRAALMHGAAADTGSTAECAKGGGAILDVLRGQAWQADRKALIQYPWLYAQIKRLAAAHGTGGTHPQSKAAGLRRIPLDGPALLRRCIDLATRAKVALVISDTRMPLEELRQYALVLCPTLELLGADEMAKFERYVLDGGFLALGPKIPFIDETMSRNETLARHFDGVMSDFELAIRQCGDGSFITLPGRMWQENIEFIVFESGLARGLVAESEALDSAVLRSRGRRLLLVANTHGQRVRTAIAGEPFSRLRNIETGEEIAAPQASRVSVPAETVAAWEVL